MNNRRNILIFKSVVDVSDNAAVTRLLDIVPESAKLRSLVKSRFAETVYDPKARRDYWIGGDDAHIACLMITGIGVDEVSKIRALFERPGISFNLQELIAHAALITGGFVHLMN